MEEKKNKSLIVIIVILVILLFCSIGYIVYDNFIKEDEVVDNNNNDNQDNEQDNEEENELSEEEIDELGKSLFNNILLLRAGYDGLLFVPSFETFLTYNTMIDKGLVMEKILEDTDKIYNESYDRDSCKELLVNGEEILNNEEYRNTCYDYYVDKSTFENLYYKIFGSDKNIDYSNMYLGCGVYIERDNKVYTYEILGCGGMSDGTPYIRYDYSKLNNNNLEIYFDYIFVQGETDIVDNTNELFESNTVKKYRATFKKDANDNYYWYSTELI